MIGDILVEAQVAYDEAFEACKPHPVVFGQAKSLFGNEIVPGTEEYCEDGVCGFAWVVIRPARGSFVKYLKSKRIGDKGVYGGYEVGSSDMTAKHRGSQSMERKEAGAKAWRDVIQKYFPDMSINAQSRMD